jgi:hypothetical protein
VGSFLRLALGLAVPLVACGGELARDPSTEPGPAAGGLGVFPGSQDPSDEVFDPTTIHDVALTMAPADWTSVRDNPGAKLWVKADFTWNGERLEQIGVRAFGAGSLIAGKPSLKLSFDRHVDRQELRGLDELKLDNASQDRGYLNEYVATAAMRRAGVPASRTGWARLTVNGQFAGFFVVLESIDDRFVERWFGHDRGGLYSMNAHNWGQGLNPMTDPLTWYEPETAFGGDGTELAAAAAALATGTMAEVEAAIDVEGFLRESVARSVMGSQDSFSADGNNFYLFDDGGRIAIIPWDFDVDLGAWYPDAAMTVDPRRPWVTSPWSYNSHTRVPYTDPVLQRALAAGADVDGIIAELLAGPFGWESVDAHAAAGAALIRDAARADVLNRGDAVDQRAYDLRLWMHARWSALAGRDVAHCPPPPPGVRRAADLGAEGTVGWDTLRVDRTQWGPGFMVAGDHHCTGLFAHAPSTIIIQVPAGYGRLRGKVGLQDWRQRCGDGARFAILHAGAEIWTGPSLRNYDAPVAFEVEVGPGTATLVTTPNGEYSCDTTAWLDLELAPR